MVIVKKISFVIAMFLGAIIGIYLVLFILAQLLSRPIKQQDWYLPRINQKSPLVLAHQGGEGEYPSNSKLAFTNAFVNGADVLDTDVHMTSDGVLILFHDETLDHRTNGRGAVRDKTFVELQQIDFAYNWSQDGGKTFPYRAKAIGVYTLDELLREFPSTRYGIELKQVSAEAVTKFCELIRRHDAVRATLVSSTQQDNMDTFRRECPEVATSATTAETTRFYIFSQLRLTGLYKPKFSSLQIPDKSGGRQIMSKNFSASAHQWGLKVINWTIDTPDQTEYFKNLGADGVNTSYPKRIIEALK